MSRPAGLFFVNTVHPRDATSSRSLSQIRSHVAKDIRARGRRARKASQLLGHNAPARRSASNRDREQGSKSSSSNTSPSRPQSTDSESIEANAITYGILIPPGPPAGVPSAGYNPFWRATRPLSSSERSLLDHYVSYIIPVDNRSCHKLRGDPAAMARLINIQLTHWIPFALSSPDLMDALFLQSARSLATLDKSQDHKELATTYRLQCIRSINNALCSESTWTSDSTISKVVIMGSDQLIIGNFDEYKVHRSALSKMVKMRGGVDTLGVGGFLKEVIVNSPVFNDYLGQALGPENPGPKTPPQDRDFQAYHKHINMKSTT